MHAVNNGLVEFVVVLKYGVGQAADWVRDPLLSPAVANTASSVTKLMRVIDFYYLAMFFGAIVYWTIRQRNVIRDDAYPCAGASGIKLEVLSHEECLRTIETLMDYDALRVEQAALRKRGVHRAIHVAHLRAAGGVAGITDLAGPPGTGSGIRCQTSYCSISRQRSSAAIRYCVKSRHGHI